MDRTTRRTVAGVPLAIVGLLVVVLVLGAGFLGIRWLLAEPTGATEAREQTIGSGSYRIAAYDRFYDDCAAAVTTQQSLTTAQAAAAAEGIDPGRQAQLDANVTALTNLLNQQVNQYNADTRKEDTRANFLASDLPYELDTTEEITCSV